VNYTDPFGLCPEFLTGRPCSDALAIGVGFIPVLGDAVDVIGALRGKDLLTGENIDNIGIGVTIVGTLLGSGKAAREGFDAARRFSKEKEALIDMARRDQRTGVTRADMEAYRELNKSLPDPFPSNKVRVDEGHSRRGRHAQRPHGHVGPIDYIPIKDP
jgi:hypothetical protein